MKELDFLILVIAQFLIMGTLVMLKQLRHVHHFFEASKQYEVGNMVLVCSCGEVRSVPVRPEL